MAEDFDFGLIGIPEDELDELFADADGSPAISDGAVDAIPEPITRPVTLGRCTRTVCAALMRSIMLLWHC